MKPEDVYISPKNEVLVTNFERIYPPHTDDKILDEINNQQYYLKVGKWYKLGQKTIAPNADDFIDVIHQDGKSIPHKPENFMSKIEWREKQLNKVIK
jgi:hypothetical protein